MSGKWRRIFGLSKASSRNITSFLHWNVHVGFHVSVLRSSIRWHKQTRLISKTCTQFGKQHVQTSEPGLINRSAHQNSLPRAWLASAILIPTNKIAWNVLNESCNEISSRVRGNNVHPECSLNATRKLSWILDEQNGGWHASTHRNGVCETFDAPFVRGKLFLPREKSLKAALENNVIEKGQSLTKLKI